MPMANGSASYASNRSRTVVGIARFALACLPAFLLVGCATGYGKSSIFGGYWNKDGPGNLVEVGFGANGYTKADRIPIYLMYRSAEIAIERKKPFFSAYSAIDKAIMGQSLNEATANTLGGKPFGKLYVLLHDTHVEGSLEAQEVLARYRPEVKSAGVEAQEPTR